MTAPDSHMRATMASQPAELRRLLADPGPVEAAANTLAGSRRVLLTGTGTSWHAANQGAWLLRRAGLDARAEQSANLSLDGWAPSPGDGVIALSHTGGKRFTPRIAAAAREAGAALVTIGARDSGAAVETVERERSATYTASHTAALLRLAQLATAMGAQLGDLSVVPESVERALAAPRSVPAPGRVLELIGGGVNEWTAAEGALKIREAAYVAAEGLGAEQFLHGPSVALRDTDALVCLDGGGPWSERLAEIADAAEASEVRVHRIAETQLGEALSIFPLTVAVQRIALEAAEELRTNPDSFGRDVPGREPWARVGL